MTSILIVDDHPVFRRGLGVLLRAAGFTIVGEAASGTEAVAAVAAHTPQIVLMDIAMPELDGIAATAQIVGAHPEIHVVVITMFADPQSIREALDAGAVGYILKDSPPDQVEAAVRAAAAGARMLGPGVPFPSPSAPPPDELALLTPREREVASLLTKGLSNRTIADRLGLTPKTAANYVASVRLKLGAIDRHDAAERIRRT